MNLLPKQSMLFQSFQTEFQRAIYLSLIKSKIARLLELIIIEGNQNHLKNVPLRHDFVPARLVNCAAIWLLIILCLSNDSMNKPYFKPLKLIIKSK